ncbi:MAG: hypothetical protein ABI384_06010, partial [Allobranchiibius sp.]
LERGRLGMTPEEVMKRVDENTIGVMPTFGVSFTFQYEPVAEVAATLPVRLEAETGGPPLRYARSLLVRVREVALLSEINQAMSELRRSEPGSAREIAQRLTALQKDLTRLRASVE